MWVGFYMFGTSKSHFLVYGSFHVKSTQKMPDPLGFGRNLVPTQRLLRHSPIVSFNVIRMASELEPAKKSIFRQILAYPLVFNQP